MVIQEGKKKDEKNPIYKSMSIFKYTETYSNNIGTIIENIINITTTIKHLSVLFNNIFFIVPKFNFILTL